MLSVKCVSCGQAAVVWTVSLVPLKNTGRVALCSPRPVSWPAFTPSPILLCGVAIMNKIEPNAAHICVAIARNGGLIITQGYLQAGLYLAREDIPRFVANAEQTKLLVIPPLAALAVHCYTCCERIETIYLKSHAIDDDVYVLTIRTASGQGIRYYSSHEDLPGAAILHDDRVNVAITPRLSAIVDSSGPKTILAPVVQLPSDEKPNYRRRFSHAPHLLSRAVARTVDQHAPALRYEN